MNVLRRLLHGCRRPRTCLDSSSFYSEINESSTPPNVGLDLYFDKKSKDFGLLMDMLAEASGIVQSLRFMIFDTIFKKGEIKPFSSRILSMFDRKFQHLWKAGNINVSVDPALVKDNMDEDDEVSGETSIIISWDDCDMADYFCKTNPGTVLEYTAEISPDTEMPIKSFQYYKSLSTIQENCLIPTKQR